MSETISSGLTLTIPVLGETNWSASIKDSCFTPISSHDHTGGGKGLQIGTTALQTDCVTNTKILAANAGWIRSRNAANSADVNLIRVNSSDVIELGDNLSWTNWVPTYSAEAPMTFTSVSTGHAKYIKLGKIVFISLAATGTTGVGAARYIRFTLPVTAVSAGVPGGSSIVDGAGVLGGACSFASTTALDIYRYDGANWGLGASRVISVNTFYEAA